MRKKRKNYWSWKGRNGRTKSIKIWWDKKGTLGKWWLIPTIHYNHLFDPLIVTFHFLKFNIEYYTVMSYTIDEFKKQFEKKFDFNKVEKGYFDL